MDLLYRKEKQELREASKKLASMLDANKITYKEFILAMPVIYVVAFKKLGYTENAINEYFRGLNKSVLATLKERRYL